METIKEITIKNQTYLFFTMILILMNLMRVKKKLIKKTLMISIFIILAMNIKGKFQNVM